MAGELDLGKLLANLEADVDACPYVYCTIADEAYGCYADCAVAAAVVEAEGLTLVMAQADAARHGFALEPSFARLTLLVHSSLHAVGLTAAVAGALARAGISANMMAGFYHDHIFVPWSDRLRAKAVLAAMVRTRQADADC